MPQRLTGYFRRYCQFCRTITVWKEHGKEECLVCLQKTTERDMERNQQHCHVRYRE